MKHSRKSLNDLSSKELVAIYNELSDKPVKKFRDKATAVDRTWAAVQANQEASKNSRLSFQFPRKEEIKNHRANTMRARIVEMLQNGGATFDQIQEATWGTKKGWSPKKIRTTTYEGIRLVHYQLGYGMNHNLDTGVITLVS